MNLDEFISKLRNDTFNAKEAAEYLKCSVETLNQWCSKKQLPYYKINGKIRIFRRLDLDRFIDRFRVPADYETEKQAAALAYK